MPITPMPATPSKVRFAPSPTGFLTVGNARTALVNWLFARRHGGRFLLRLDDTDTERSSPEFAEAIEHDLRWLDMEIDETARQSDRFDRYRAAFDRLRAGGRLYPCYETPEELEFKRRRLLARGRPPIYDRAALTLTEADRRRLEEDGRRPHWRFQLAHVDIDWTDLVRGRQHFHGGNLSDPVLVRADGSWLYMLPSTVDDIDHSISHVIRGEDHVVNTAVQIQLFSALGAEPPSFAHLPLLTDISGKGLSKRLGSITLQSLRQEGVEPMALTAYLAALGTGAPAELLPSLAAHADRFDIAAYGRATPKFDDGQLWHLNARALQQMPFAAVADRLRDMGLAHAEERFWQAVRANLGRLAEARTWHAVCFEAIEPVADDPDLLERATALLPAEPWDADTWSVWTKTVGKETGRKGRGLFMPLRLALTGSDHGPELKALLPLIGRERALDRLASAAAVAPRAQSLQD